MTESTHPRTVGREGVFQALYSHHISNEAPAKIIADLQERHNFDSDTRKYVNTLFMRALEHKTYIIEIISKHLENWEWNRVALLDRLVLQLAVTELLYIDDVPPKVTIAEAINIARIYSTNDSTAFVNGILDAIYKEHSDQEDG